MDFQVSCRDLLGRAGVLKTKSGAFQTPHMFPVIDPNHETFSQEFLKDLGVNAIMTNAYLLRRSQRDEGKPRDVHQTIGFDETIATDSGAYQILEYGGVAVKPSEIVAYQEAINSDIGVILDVPTGFRSDPARARWTVDETIRRADEALKVMTREDILWVGPIQGGVHLREVARSAREMTKRNFSIYALGSPTELMKAQHFEVLVDMIITAKRVIPPSKPFHLFGAGHPILLPFLVALGCDLFDSAAYALYARTDRYFTQEGTYRLNEMEEFPCLCKTCASTSPSEMRHLGPPERERLLSQHNLRVCFSELRRIREALRKGRLWDLLESRAHVHPALKRCLARIARYTDVLERHTPVVKPRGIFYFGSLSDARPEIMRYKSKIAKIPLPHCKVVVLLPGRWRRPFHEDPRYQLIVRRLRNRNGVLLCFYSVPFGPVPLELDEIFPLAQTETFDPEDRATYLTNARLLAQFLGKMFPATVFLTRDDKWGRVVEREILKVVSPKGLVSIRGEDLKPESLIRVVDEKLDNRH